MSTVQRSDLVSHIRAYVVTLTMWLQKIVTDHPAASQKEDRGFRGHVTGMTKERSQNDQIVSKLREGE